MTFTKNCATHFLTTDICVYELTDFIKYFEMRSTFA